MVMKARAIPTDRAMTGTAVAHVRCFGENHTELRRGGEIRRGGPTMPIMMCPMCMSTTHLELSGTAHRIPIPMARTQALMRTDFLRPKRSRNHICTKVIGIKRIGSYAASTKFTNMKKIRYDTNTLDHLYGFVIGGAENRLLIFRMGTCLYQCL